MGVNRNTNKIIIYGSKNLGGLGLFDWFHLQGEGQIKNFVSHWRAKTKISSILKITSSWAQQFAGTSEYFLATKHRISYLPNGWMKNLADYLQETKTKIRVDEPKVYLPQREHDVHIMDKVIECGIYTAKEQEMFNDCHLHLRVTTVSDLANLDGTHIAPAARIGNYVFLDSEARGHHIRTRRSGKDSWKLWNQVLRSFMDKSGKLYQPLGRWTQYGNQLKRIWNNYYNTQHRCAYRREGCAWRRYIKIGPKYQKDLIVNWEPTKFSIPCKLHRVNKQAVKIEGHIIRTPEKQLIGNIQNSIDAQPDSIIQLLVDH